MRTNAGKLLRPPSEDAPQMRMARSDDSHSEVPENAWHLRMALTRPGVAEVVWAPTTAPVLMILRHERTTTCKGATA